MTYDQIVIFALLGLVLALLIWGRWRYDAVAFGALVAALVLGVVPYEEAFSGFGHPATVVIALVLIVSKGLSNAGVVDRLGRIVSSDGRPVPLHIAIMAGIGALLSAVMNNVAALALLMPLDLQAAAKAKRAAGKTLMALSFATILGGLVTLIGTPPNIVVAAFRDSALGSPFGFFDFAPVGGAVALAGLAFIALIGWRLVPVSEKSENATEGFDLQDYIAEGRITEKSPLVGETAREAEARLADASAEAPVELIAILRNGVRLSTVNPSLRIAAGDVFVIEAPGEQIEPAMKELGLEYLLPEQQEEKALQDLTFIELVVPPGAWLEGRSAGGSGLFYRFALSLVGVSRRGRRVQQRLRNLRIEAGDVLLLLVPEGRQGEVISWTGCLPLEPRGLPSVKEPKALLAAGIFAAAIGLASAGLLPLTAAFALCVMLFLALRLIGGAEAYGAIEWPVIVLLGAMIPLGAALEASGGTAIVASGLLTLAAGQPAWVAVGLLLVITMTLSDVLNNVATAVIAAPVGLQMAEALDVNPDPFLMAVALGASCAFLTPIGHKNNILVLGPGGYRFGDYWRMGLPLEILIVALGLPTILLVWPL